MNCPGQADGPTDPFYFTLKDTPERAESQQPSLPNNSQFKCYDGLHNFNQVQPAPYDGMYKFPSVTSIDPATGKPTGTNCTICVAESYRDGTADAACRQVRGRNDRAAGLRTREGRRQEHPHRRQLHRAGHAAVRRSRQHLHPARPGRR